MRTRRLLALPASTAEAEDGPVLEHRPGELILSYDSEAAWTSVVFTGALAHRFTPDGAVEEWMLAAYSAVAEVLDSPWIAALRVRQLERCELDAFAGARHLLVHFDHLGCVEVVAEAFGVHAHPVSPLASAEDEVAQVLLRLPDTVRAHARVSFGRQLSWPGAFAAEAIAALADAGLVIASLDARDAKGRVEIPVGAWRVEEGESRAAALQRTRREALDLLPAARGKGTHVRIGWR